MTRRSLENALGMVALVLMWALFLSLMIVWGDYQ